MRNELTMHGYSKSKSIIESCAFEFTPWKDMINRRTTQRNVKTRNLKYALRITAHSSEENLFSFCLLIREKPIWIETSRSTSPNTTPLINP